MTATAVVVAMIVVQLALFLVLLAIAHVLGQRLLTAQRDLADARASLTVARRQARAAHPTTEEPRTL